MFSSHCHSFNKQPRKEYINKNWLEFHRSEHESYVSNSWFLVVRESFIFIWILINRADMVSCPFSHFSFPFFHISFGWNPVPHLSFRYRFGIIQSSAYFQLKWCSSIVDDCKMSKNCSDPKICYLCRHELCLSGEVANGPKIHLILRTSKRILITKQWTKRCLMFVEYRANAIKKW